MDTDKTLTEYIAEELRALRARPKGGVTFDELQDRTGVAKASLKRYFNGHRAIPTDVIDSVAAAFDTSAWQIVRDAEAHRTKDARSNVVPIRKSVPTEEEALELGAVAKDQVQEVDEFDGPGDDE